MHRHTASPDSVRPQAAVKTFASRPESKRRIAELAGNAVPMELMLVVLRACALLPGRVSRVGATAARCRECEPGFVVTVGSESRPVAIGLIVEPSSPSCQNDTIF